MMCMVIRLRLIDSVINDEVFFSHCSISVNVKEILILVFVYIVLMLFI